MAITSFVLPKGTDGSVSQVRLYDEIIVSGQNLYDGKTFVVIDIRVKKSDNSKSYLHSFCKVCRAPGAA